MGGGGDGGTSRRAESELSAALDDSPICPKQFLNEARGASSAIRPVADCPTVKSPEH